MVSICANVNVRHYAADEESYDHIPRDLYRPDPPGYVECPDTVANTLHNKNDPQFRPVPCGTFAPYRTRVKSADSFFSQDYEGVTERPGPIVRGDDQKGTLRERNAYTDKIEKMLVAIFEKVVYGQSKRPNSTLIPQMLKQFPDSKPADFAQVCTLCSKKIEQLESKGMASLYIVGTSLKACHLDTTKKMKEMLKEHVMNELHKAIEKKERIEKELHKCKMVEVSHVYPHEMMVPISSAIMRCEILSVSALTELSSPTAIASP